MPSLDIAALKPSLQAHLVPLGAVIHAKTVSNPWKHSRYSKHLELYLGNHHVQRGKLVVTAVATLEPKCPVEKEDEQSDSQLFASLRPSSGQNGRDGDEESEQVNEREMLRRMRISKANQGNTPWNKGRKHSAETLQKIRERTKIAMQNPKIKMKLANLGHAQSKETRLKIGEGVRLGWERRKERKMVQERCHFEWQNLIAEAARRGCADEEELHWDSYKILNKQLEREWLESIEQRKAMVRPKGNKRAPKSLEQRRKIAEAIAAKWADPAYRDRVCSGLAKYHGTPTGAERKPRRKPSSNTEPRKRSSANKSTRDAESSSGSEHISQIQLLRLRKRKTPVYKDPLASSKLEMIKSIRAKRAAAESKKIEAVEQARLLIAEAEKAAKALELAATRSPVARASLLESRKLIAEATQLIESIESGQTMSNEDRTYPSVVLRQPINLLKEDTVTENSDTNKGKSGEINRAQTFLFHWNEEPSSFTVNGDRDALQLGFSPSNSPTFNLDRTVNQSVSAKQPDHLELDRNIKLGMNPQPNGTRVHPSEPHRTTEVTTKNCLPNGTKVHIVEEKEAPSKAAAITKKWVRGRLVEVTEGA